MDYSEWLKRAVKSTPKKKELEKPILLKRKRNRKIVLNRACTYKNDNNNSKNHEEELSSNRTFLTVRPLLLNLAYSFEITNKTTPKTINITVLLFSFK